MIRKVELQIAAKDFVDARKTIEAMRLASIRTEFCDWYEARILMDEDKWYQANACSSSFARFCQRTHDLPSI